MAIKTFVIDHSQITFTDLPHLLVIVDLNGSESTSKTFKTKKEALYYYNIKCRALCAKTFTKIDKEIKDIYEN